MAVAAAAAAATNIAGITWLLSRAYENEYAVYVYVSADEQGANYIWAIY